MAGQNSTMSGRERLSKGEGQGLEVESCGQLQGEAALVPAVSTMLCHGDPGCSLGVVGAPVPCGMQAHCFSWTVQQPTTQTQGGSGQRHAQGLGMGMGVVANARSPSHVLVRPAKTTRSSTTH